MTGIVIAARSRAGAAGPIGIRNWLETPHAGVTGTGL